MFDSKLLRLFNWVDCLFQNLEHWHILDTLSLSKSEALARARRFVVALIQNGIKQTHISALTFGRCFSSRSPACPGCRRPTVRTPSPPWRPKHPGRLDREEWWWNRDWFQQFVQRSCALLVIRFLRVFRLQSNTTS